MTTLLAEYDRKASHGLHVCAFCRRKIKAGSQYLDQRLADGGSAWTFRAHHACNSAYWSWVDHDEEELMDLREFTEGHLPPCWHAWNREPWDYRLNGYRPFIGPKPPCGCEATQ
jgi:hypothetical protein